MNSLSQPDSAYPQSGQEMTSARQPVRIATWIAAAVAAAIFVLLPAGYFSLAYNAKAAASRTTAQVKAEAVSHIVASSPDLWTFQEHRLEELLARHPQLAEGERACVKSLAGTPIVCIGDAPALPRLHRSVSVFDYGKRVATLEIAVTLRPVLGKTAIAAALGLIFGILIFVALRTLPTRALDRALTALRQEKERAEITLRSIADAVITTDAGELVMYLNPAAEQLTGWQSADAGGQPLDAIFRLVDEMNGNPVKSPLGLALAKKRVVPAGNHTVLTRRDGSMVPIEDTAAPILDKDGTLLGGVLVFHDVSAARKLSGQLTWQATHDALTGLNNRVEFDRMLDEAVMNARTEHVQHALCYVDLDQFKVVNDTCGHSAGDQMLRQIATLLAARVRRSDTLARLGGDEFGLLLHGCSLTQATEIAEGILDGLKGFRFSWEDKVFRIGASVGISAISPLTSSAQRVLSSADSACYSAKEAGRGRVHVFRYEDKELADRHEQMGWVSVITRALEEHRFRLFYQPIRSLAPERNAAPHIELLIRLVGDNGKIIAPGSFIPSAERYNLAPAIDRWVIASAFELYPALATQFGKDVVIGVNLSGETFADTGFPAFVMAEARRRNVPPDAYCMEITETAAINNLARASAFIKQLSQFGFRFALDDFGAGMSSFGYLKNLPVDYLKIDGALVRDIARDPISRCMVKAINDIAKAMALKTVAEYAEDDAIIEALGTIGVDFAQGFGIARPRPLANATEEPTAAATPVIA